MRRTSDTSTARRNLFNHNINQNDARAHSFRADLLSLLLKMSAARVGRVMIRTPRYNEEKERLVTQQEQKKGRRLKILCRLDTRAPQRYGSTKK